MEPFGWKVTRSGRDFVENPSTFRVARSLSLLSLTLAVLAMAGCGMSHKATLHTFAGYWWGHARGLMITRDGRARESIYSGCCDHVVDLTFRLSQLRGTPQLATATAVVTAVHVYDQTGFSPSLPPPRVGQKGTIKLRDHVIDEGLTGINYCGVDAPDVCGA